MKLNKFAAALLFAFALAGSAAYAQQQQPDLTPDDLWGWSAGRSYGLMNGCVVQEVNRLNGSQENYNNVVTRYYDFISETVLTHVENLKSSVYTGELTSETPFSQLSTANIERVRALGAQIAQTAQKSGRKYPDSVDQFLKDCSAPRRATTPTVMPKAPG